MKRWVGLAILIFVGVAGWRIGGALSSDALSMAVGVLFGVMAGVPMALLLMASARRRDEREVSGPLNHGAGPAHDPYALQPWHPTGSAMGYSAGQPARQMHHAAMPYPMPPQQPPVIVVTGPQETGTAAYRDGIPTGWSPQASSPRRFKVVGEQEAWLDEW